MGVSGPLEGHGGPGPHAVLVAEYDAPGEQLLDVLLHFPPYPRAVRTVLQVAVFEPENVVHLCDVADFPVAAQEVLLQQTG